MKFTVSGTMSKEGMVRVFSKTVEAQSQAFAVEKVITQLGSNNGMNRRNIKVEKVEKAE